jgi:hypothetical protein
MSEATFRFYAELNDFLPPEMRQRPLIYPFTEPQTIKHLIEAVRIPHTDVELILINGEPAGFEVMVQPGDRVSVYPAFYQIDISALPPLRPPLPHPPRFILDNHLGKLARLMRLLGIDTLYPRAHLDDAELAQIAYAENRIMLTRDRGLLMRSIITYGYCLHTTNTEQQLTAVLHRYHLHQHVHPWTRCLNCNGRLHTIPKQQIAHRLQPKTSLYFDEFRECQACGQIYWKGSHFASLQEIVDRVVTEKP